jgi:hypothetical protein
LQSDNVVAELADSGTVGDEDHRFVMAVVEETAEEFVFGLLVERRTDFIEKKDAAGT